VLGLSSKAAFWAQSIWLVIPSDRVLCKVGVEYPFIDAVFETFRNIFLL
jgi:hypothetical protein